MSIEKIGAPLSGNEMSTKINEIIENMGSGDVTGIALDGENIVLDKANGESYTADLSSMRCPLATESNDGLLTKSDYTLLRSVEEAIDSNTALTEFIIPFATCPTESNVYDKIATVANGISFSLKQGAIIMVAFQYAPYVSGGHALRMNVNNTGLKNITYCGISNSYYTPASTITRIMFVYDGSNWVATTPFAYTYAATSESGGS